MQAGPALRRLEIISLSTHRAASQMPAIGSWLKCPFGRRCPLSEQELIKRGWVAEVPFEPNWASGQAWSLLPQLSPSWWRKVWGWQPEGATNAFISLHLWIGSGVADCVVTSSSQSRLRLVLPALQTYRNVFFGAACRRHLLFIRAADGEWSDIQSERIHGRASHVAFRITGDGNEPSQRGVCYRGDQ